MRRLHQTQSQKPMERMFPRRRGRNKKRRVYSFLHFHIPAFFLPLQHCVNLVNCLNVYSCYQTDVELASCTDSLGAI